MTTPKKNAAPVPQSYLMKLLRRFRSTRNRRRHSRIPLLGESMTAFNQLGDTLAPVPARPVLAPCFMPASNTILF